MRLSMACRAGRAAASGSRWTISGDAVRIVIEDDGTGLPPDFDPAQQSSSLGLHIVHTLVTDDLKGTLLMRSVVPDSANGADTANATGTQAIVTFPKRSVRVG